jgi:hypothetical protein
MPKYFLMSLTLTSFIIFSCEKKHENESNQRQIEESILKNERQNDEVLYDSPTDTVESLYIGEENIQDNKVLKKHPTLARKYHIKFLRSPILKQIFNNR